MGRYALVGIISLASVAGCAAEEASGLPDEATVSVVMDDAVVGAMFVVVEYMHWDCPESGYCTPPDVLVNTFVLDYPAGVQPGDTFELGTFPTAGTDADCVPQIEVIAVCGFHEGGPDEDCNIEPGSHSRFWTIGEEQFPNGTTVDIVPGAQIWFDVDAEGWG